MKKTNKFLSVFLALLMIFSIIPMASIEAEAITYSGSASYMSGKYYTQLCNVILTGDGATDIVNVAKSQIGYKSGSSNSDLSGSTSSTLNDKYSEYGRVIGSNPNDWCAYFVSWCARQAGVSKSVLPNFAGCTTAYNTTLPNAGCTMHRRTTGYVPVKGDIIFFGTSSSNIYHVGIVTSATSSTVYYIDGNNTSTTPHCVASSSRSLTNSTIWGYATPDYEESNTLSIRYDANGGTIAGSDKTYNVYKVASSAGVNLRSGAGTSYDTLLTIPKGGSFVVTETSKAEGYTWGKTTYGSKTGWCVISEDWTTKNGTQPQTKYYLNSSDVIYKSSTSKVFAQEMVDGTTYSSGLYNYTTFGISRKGYTFKGWGTKASGGTVYSQSESMTAKKLCSTIGNGDQTITLYAIWVPNELSVHYNANGGKVTLDEFTLNSGLIYKNSGKFVQTWQYNIAKDNGLINPKSFGLERTGYKFAGWGTTSAGGTIFDQNDTGLLPTEINSNLKNGNCSTTLYALWNANTYTVKYNANGGIGTVSNSSHTYNTSKTLNANKFTRTGYTFLGWSTSSTATTAKYTDKQSVKNLTSTNGGTVTLYAVWSQNEHTPGTWTVVTAATCMTDGLTRQRCTVCGEIIAEKELPATGHTESNWSIVTEATCTTEGVQQKTCTVCGEIIEKEEISALGHIETEWITEIEPTCTEDGLKYEKCLVCGEIIDKEEISVIDHIHGEWETILEATCVEAGYKIQPCINCGEILATEEIPATGHTAGEWETVTESSCVALGSKVQKCTVCGVTLATDGTSSFGHISGDWEVVKTPDCESTGTQIKKCTVCNETVEREEIPATGHTTGEWETITNATCTEKGLKVQNCTECGTTLATEDIAVAEHVKGDWEIVEQPTCVLTGLRVQSCTECGETLAIEEISTSEHTESAWKVAIHSTCSAVGFKIKQCTECGEVLQTEEIPAKEHTFANGICLVCNETDPSYAPNIPVEYSFSIQKPSRTEFRNKDGIILHANVEGTAPAGSYVVWTSSNGNFDEDDMGNGKLEIIAKNKGWTTFTATLYDADGNFLASDSVEMYSKSGFFDKIGGFFRSLFGTTKIYDN